MKSKLITITCSTFFLLASFNAGAQNNAAPAIKPEAKIVTDNNTANPDAKKVTTPAIKEPAKPKVLPLQKSEPPKQDVVTDQSKANNPELKGIEVAPNTKKGIEPKNIDRPKASTLSTDQKKVEPVVMPTPKIIKPDE